MPVGGATLYVKYPMNFATSGSRFDAPRRPWRRSIRGSKIVLTAAQVALVIAIRRRIGPVSARLPGVLIGQCLHLVAILVGDLPR